MRKQYCHSRESRNLAFLYNWIPAFVGMTVLFFFFTFPAHAADVNKNTLAQVESYLSGLTTIVSDFVQVAPDGSLSGGKFYLKRPGKMRWQYEPPTPIIMVSNGRNLIYYDYELDQETNIPIDSTLVGFLAKEKIAFSSPVKVTDFKQETGIIRITVVQENKPTDGELTLEFSDKPLALKNMVITDANKQVTNVSLNNARFGPALDDKLFVLENPKIFRKKK